jgi:hypothetical protein
VLGHTTAFISVILLAYHIVVGARDIVLVHDIYMGFIGAVLNLFQVLYWFIGVDVRKPQTPPNTSIQKYKLQPKHNIETSPRWGKERLHYVAR